MLNFAITTTSKLAAISLHDGEKVLGEIKIEVPKTHSKSILDQIDKLFKWSEKSLDEVENILISIGPGSFTGVRIAISVVKGMFFNKKVDFYVVNELDALAYQGYFSIECKREEDQVIYSLIDSGKEKVYYAKYKVKDNGLEQNTDYKVEKLSNIIEEVLLENNENGKIYLSGDAVLNYKNIIKDNLGDKITLIEDGSLKISSTTFNRMFFIDKLEKKDIYSLKPYYLEKTQAERDKE